MRRQQGLLPNRIKLEIHDGKIEVGCLTTIKEEAAYDDVFPTTRLISHWPLFIICCLKGGKRPPAFI
jgi:hypothetical protein